MADVQPGGNAGSQGAAGGAAGMSSSASPDRSQSGGSSQASITPPTDNNNNNNAASSANANNNAGERALAQAQMATIGNNPRGPGTTGTGRRRGDPAQDEAVMGVAESGAYEALDEGGEMVRVRFLDFLQTL